MQAPAALLSAKARNICAGNKSGAAGFRFAQKGGHQAMRIDDAGGRRKKNARALQRWFNLANLGWLKPAQIVDALDRQSGDDGQECVSTCRSGVYPENKTKKKTK